MMLHDEHNCAHRDTERPVDAQAVSDAMQAQAVPSGRYELMLKVLGRDDALRASYLRRRWQGLTR
jgi:hypothetical protein